MDSLTHIVLGAAIGELVAGRNIGRRAMLMGAIANTVPDLDVFCSLIFDDPLQYLRIHRAYSHALFTHVLISFPLAYISYLLVKKKMSYRHLYIFWLISLASHSMIDCCTTYGTQLFLPFSKTLVSFNNINIIDPLLTLPFLFCMIISIASKRISAARRNWAIRGLVTGGCYMIAVLGVKAMVHQHFTAELRTQKIAYENLSTVPTILNGMLWAGIATNDSDITIGEYSIFQKHKNTDFVAFKRNLQFEKKYACGDFDLIKWFGQDKYFFEQLSDSSARFYIAKWGRFDFDKSKPVEAFGFYYTLTKKSDNTVGIVVHEPSDEEFKIKDAFIKLWNRIFYY